MGFIKIWQSFFTNTKGSVGIEAIWAGLVVSFFIAPTVYLYQHSNTHLDASWAGRSAAMNQAINSNCNNEIFLPLPGDLNKGVHSLTTIDCTSQDGEKDVPENDKMWKKLDSVTNAEFSNFTRDMKDKGAIKAHQGRTTVTYSKGLELGDKKSEGLLDKLKGIATTSAPKKSVLLAPSTDYYTFDDDKPHWSEGHDKRVWEEFSSNAKKLFPNVYPSSGAGGATGSNSSSKPTTNARKVSPPPQTTEVTPPADNTKVDVADTGANPPNGPSEGFQDGTDQVADLTGVNVGQPPSRSGSTTGSDSISPVLRKSTRTVISYRPLPWYPNEVLPVVGNFGNANTTVATNVDTLPIITDLSPDSTCSSTTAIENPVSSEISFSEAGSLLLEFLHLYSTMLEIKDITVRMVEYYKLVEKWSGSIHFTPAEVSKLKNQALKGSLGSVALNMAFFGAEYARDPLVDWYFEEFVPDGPNKELKKQLTRTYIDMNIVVGVAAIGATAGAVVGAPLIVAGYTAGKLIEIEQVLDDIVTTNKGTTLSSLKFSQDLVMKLIGGCTDVELIEKTYAWNEELIKSQIDKGGSFNVHNARERSIINKMMLARAYKFTGDPAYESVMEDIANTVNDYNTHPVGITQGSIMKLTGKDVYGDFSKTIAEKMGLDEYVAPEKTTTTIWKNASNAWGAMTNIF